MITQPPQRVGGATDLAHFLVVQHVQMGAHGMQRPTANEFVETHHSNFLVGIFQRRCDQRLVSGLVVNATQRLQVEVLDAAKSLANYHAAHRIDRQRIPDGNDVLASLVGIQLDDAFQMDDPLRH